MATWTTNGQTVEVNASSRGAVTIEVDVPSRHEGVTLRLSREDAERLVAEIQEALNQ
jgi:hypothetical protein